MRAIESLIACTAALPQSKNPIADLVNQIDLLLNGVGDGNITLDFLKGRLRGMQWQIQHNDANDQPAFLDLIGKIRAVANLIFRLLHPEGKDHPEIAQEKQELLKGVSNLDEAAAAAESLIATNDTVQIRTLCRRGMVSFLPPQTAMQLWTWAKVCFETEVFSALLAAFRIDPPLIGAVVAEAFAQGRFEEIADHVIFYHFGALNESQQRQIAFWIYQRNGYRPVQPSREQAAASISTNPPPPLAGPIANANNDLFSLLRQSVVDGNFVEIERLLKNPDITEMDSKEFQEVFNAALRRETPDALSLLAQYPSFNELDRPFLFRSLESLIRQRRFDMAKILMSTASFSRLPVRLYHVLSHLLAPSQREDLVQLVQQRLNGH